MEIKTITTRFILNVSVNCYLIGNGDDYLLIDTGMPTKRRAIEKELVNAGCLPEHLKLIILTHGDVDHCGNAAYLRARFGAEIAMHSDDAGMVKNGDMFWNRKAPSGFVRAIFNRFLRLRKSDRFTPDAILLDGQDLSPYGFDAEVISIPGHSKGSLGVLTAGGDLFCGDLLANTDKPDLWSIIDDPAAADSSVARLSGLEARTVYPGHGRPFTMAELRALP